MRCRRLSYVCALVTLLTLSPANAAAKPGTSWAQAELKTVVAAGLMAKAAAARPNDSLTRGELDALVAGLTHTQPLAAANPSAKVTMAALDSRLVVALGLTDTARLFTQSAKTAGLAPPSRFGTEAVARLLGLRTNHPAALDALELSPGEPATHAEAAYSAARMLQLGEFDPAALQALAESFVLPDLTAWQKSVLATAVHFIGYPYVWGGESEFPESPFGPQAHGGFDCSGFVWRVYKIQKYANEGTLADTLQGRTTFAMSGEVPAAKRISLANLQPADVLFFGAKGPKSKPAQVDHTGIYLGNGWFIHSSGYGVAVTTLTGSYVNRFAWGRRPLAEAKLVPPA
jgi:cell wall-associated NlpC family hydrolase